MKKLLSIVFSCSILFTTAQGVSTEDYINQEITDEVISEYYNNNISKHQNTSTINFNNKEPFTSMVLKERLALLNAKTPFDVPYNATIERFIRLYIRDKKEAISNLMDRANYYFPLFEEHLDKFDIPLEIKYLAVVESALLPTATSHAGAKGIWQFMYHTGKQYGLNITSYVDERKDPLKATIAACKYLKYLYNTFEDWDLALAAYNSGPGNVRKAITRSGGKRNYWNIRQYLPQETSSYIPAFYAMYYLFEYGHTHQIYPNNTEINYFDTDTIHVNQKLSFSQIEQKTGVTKETLTSLNPQYKLGIIPYSANKTYVLTLPKNAIDTFLNSTIEEYNGQENKEKITHLIPTTDNSYVVQPSDNLPKIARKHGITLSQLKRWNGLQTDFLIEGQRLVITDKKSEVALQVPIKEVVQKQKNVAKPKTYKIYTVKQGDSLFVISKKFNNVSVDQLRDWNNIWGVSYIKPGTELKILTSTE
ncbi:LysM peptidoglycan-binding domain-containing protein [Aureibaculum marinum]|uniref:LysM peptidoglycan-binding domain-containing protein n=1 Tax=Aureibaculum marinum TaxID=2487930 RepID=A0A3N4PKU7_9FLAO|nr:lytic transglycosylase domain-containing protein [Aureibaculum marinum]RPE00234.1 LysM peptidoglycan-binding domain-containing protein [Aureibaculum marinum]